jgi:hypothetical protein
MDDLTKLWLTFWCLFFVCATVLGSVIAYQDNQWRIVASTTALEMVKAGASPIEAKEAVWNKTIQISK